MDLTYAKNNEKRICPYLDIECRPVCPAWLEEVTDCLFHVCLTQVQSIFFRAAQYLDEHLNLPDGTGMDTLKRLRANMTGEATEEDKITVNAVLNGLLTSGVLSKIARLTLSDLAGILGQVEGKVGFNIEGLFSGSDEEEDDNEDLIFTKE